MIKNLCHFLPDFSPAPNKLQKIIRCNCQTDCSNMRCTYKRHNVKCSVACGKLNAEGQDAESDDNDNAEDAA